MAEARYGHVPPSLVSSLKEALKSRTEREEPIETTGPMDQVSCCNYPNASDGRPCVLVVNEQGLHGPGMQALVQALLGSGSCNVYVCVPQCYVAEVGRSTSMQKTLEVGHIDFEGVIAYEVSGTTVDCISLSLCGALFPKKPILVLCGINRGSSCGHDIFSSGTVAAAREAFSHGVPSVALSLDWKKGESQEDDFHAAAAFCLPLICKAMSDAQSPPYHHGFFLNINIPTPFLQHKGFRITRRGSSRPHVTWRAAPSQRGALKTSFCKENGIGARVAQLGLAASAVGAARRANSSLKNIEVESVAGSENGSHDSAAKRKSFYQMEIGEMVGESDNTSDYGALREGFVSVTPLGSVSDKDITLTKLTKWMASFLVP